MAPNAANASQAGAHLPHAGKPLPGGKIKAAPWWAGLSQRCVNNLWTLAMLACIHGHEGKVWLATMIW